MCDSVHMYFSVFIGLPKVTTTCKLNEYRKRVTIDLMVC